MDSMSLLAETFAPLDGKRLLDIGCGEGYLARSLGKRGAAVSGVDPDPKAVEKARSVAPGSTFIQGSAESLPFDDGSFDGSIFLNSLHHVPGDVMAAALVEAARVTAAGAPIVVIEPLAEGSFFEAFRPIEDETEVRRKAQDAIDGSIAGGRLREVRSFDLNRVETFDTIEAFVERVTAVDPARRAVVAENRQTIEAAFRNAAARDENGRYVLEQPLKARILQAA